MKHLEAVQASYMKDVGQEKDKVRLQRIGA